MYARTSGGLILSLVLSVSMSPVQAADAELQRFQGKWEVIELVEDGRVIPAVAIEDWLPSGGRLEIVDNAIISVSPHDGKKEVKIFAIDATQSPRGIEISTRDQREVWGIYRFDQDRLVMCLVDHTDGSRPDEFSARTGSKRLLMTLRPVDSNAVQEARRPELRAQLDLPEPLLAPTSTSTPLALPLPEPPLTVTPTPAPTPVPGTAAPRLLSDSEVTEMLRGTCWRYCDAYGALLLTLHADGRFATTREYTELLLFQKVFVRNMISCGQWTVQNGRLCLHILTSVDPSRVNARVPFTLRVVTEKDLIFVDHLGHVGQAVRVK